MCDYHCYCPEEEASVLRCSLTAFQSLVQGELKSTMFGCNGRAEEASSLKYLFVNNSPMYEESPSDVQESHGLSRLCKSCMRTVETI